MEGYTEFIIAVGTLVTALVTGSIKLYTLHKENLKLKDHKENNDIKLKIYEEILNIKSISTISNAISDLFEKTVADRFLIIMGIEISGQVTHISVIFEQHNYLNHQIRVNAIARYNNVEIDNNYRDMIKHIQLFGSVDIEVKNMEDSLLKNFYITEGVTFSKVKFLKRKTIKQNKDLVCFSSIATHASREFNDKEKTEIKIIYDGIILPIVSSLLDGKPVDDISQILYN